MIYSMEQLRKRSRVRSDNGLSVLGGCNFEGYPRHHFQYALPLAPSAPLAVHVAGEDEWKNGAFRYRHNSDIFALELVTEGEFLIESGHMRYTVPPGSLFFVHLHQDSAMMCSSPYAVKYTVILYGPLLENLLASLQLNECRVLKLHHVSAVEREMRRIGTLLGRKTAEARHRADVTAYSLLLHLAREQHTPPPDAMQKILELIHVHLNRMYSIADLSRTTGLGAATIHRMFQQYCRCTPLAYMTQCRMTAAAQMLRSGERSIKEISSSLGYRNQLYFSAAFRKYHGISPSGYRLRTGREEDS